jgi:peptide/nickel transport system substrate-binding protein
MQRRLWLLVGAVAAVLVLAISATATTKVAGSTRASSLAAAPFAQAWANVPRTAAGRKAKDVLVFGSEQDPAGFNTLQATENSFWAQVQGPTVAVRGIYIVDNKGQYVLDLASSVTATKTALTINLRPDANWNWGGKKVPVTNADLVYTWKQIVDPKNQAASTTGYDQIASVKLKGTKTAIFTWKAGKPFADYRDMFGIVLPSKAVVGQDFNTFWSNCICGTDGKPISDGPFILTNFTKGQGVTLKANPLWYGKKPGLKEIDFKLLTDTNSEIQAMRGGEVDAIFPSPQTALSELVHQSGLTYNATPGFVLEHLDFQMGPQGHPLLKQLWMRQAIALAINRASLIKAIFSSYAPGQKPLNNLLYLIGPDSVPHFNRWATAPAKALAMLKAHCTGGPTKPTRGNTAIWTCNGQQASFRWFTTVGNQRRATSEAIFEQQLGAIGIKINPTFMPGPAVLFGKVLPSHDYDIAEYAGVFGSPDPSNQDSTFTPGDGNYVNYNNPKYTALINSAEADLVPASRKAKFQQADTILANDVPNFPLYASPVILVHKSAVKGMENSNNPTSVGPTWNAEEWHW